MMRKVTAAQGSLRKVQCCAVIVEALVHVDALLQVLLEQQNLPIPCCREEGHNVPPPRSRQGWPTAASRRVSGRAFGRRMSKGRTRSNYRVVRLVSSLTPHLAKAPLLLDFLNHFPTVEKPAYTQLLGRVCGKDGAVRAHGGATSAAADGPVWASHTVPAHTGAQISL